MILGKCMSCGNYCKMLEKCDGCTGIFCPGCMENHEGPDYEFRKDVERKFGRQIGDTMMPKVKCSICNDLVIVSQDRQDLLNDIANVLSGIGESKPICSDCKQALVIKEWRID